MASVIPVKLAYNYFEPQGDSVEKPPIIFCHGLSCSKEYWDPIPQIVADATKRKVYAIDSRNHGDTEWSDVFNFDINVDDLLHFMDTIGARTATIVGHSMGGITAIGTALRAPERVYNIVVEDIPVSRISTQILDMVTMLFELGKTVLEKLPPGIDEGEAKRTLFRAMIDNVPPELRSVLKEETMDNRQMQLRRLDDGRLAFKCNTEVLMKASQKPDDIQSDASGLYEGPACFIYGTLSPFNVPGDEVNIKKFFPRAQLLPVKNATHNVHSDCREEFTEALINFLKKKQ